MSRVQKVPYNKGKDKVHGGVVSGRNLLKITTNGFGIDEINNTIGVHSPDNMNAVGVAGWCIYDLSNILLLSTGAVRCVRHFCG
jgi:hypothetical protein